MSNRRQVLAAFQEAAAHIVALINSRPSSPRLDEISGIIACACTSHSPAPPVSPLALKIREAISLAHMAEQADCEIESCDKEGEARTAALVEKRWAELEALLAEIPDPPLLFEHALMRAEVAYHFAEKDAGGRLIFNDVDCVKGPAVRLIKSILQLGGRYHH